MLSVIFLNMAGYMFTIGFAPVANSAATYYNVTGDMVDMFPLVGMGANVPGLFAALFCIDKFGIKVGQYLISLPDLCLCQQKPSSSSFHVNLLF